MILNCNISTVLLWHYGPDLQNQSKKHVGCDLHFAQGINKRVALVTVLIGADTGDDIVDLEHDRLPIEIPSIANRENNPWNGKSPNEQINADMPTWMNRTPFEVEEAEVDHNRVVQESEKDLS